MKVMCVRGGYMSKVYGTICCGKTEENVDKNYCLALDN